MLRLNLLAAGALIALFVASFLGTGHGDLYLNAVGLAIVVSGTLAATVLSYPLADIGAALRVARNSYASSPPSDREIVDALLDLAVRSRHEGVLALEKAENTVTVAFLRNALGMLVDGYRESELRDILTTEMVYFRKRREQHVRLFRQMARLAPAFGVAGSVVGLVAMLADLGDPDTILRTIPIALTSTLYGIVLGNLLLGPVGEAIHRKTARELFAQQLIADGVLAIRSEQNTVKLAKKLEAFLTPSARPANERSFREIRNRYREVSGVDLADTSKRLGEDERALRAPG